MRIVIVGAGAIGAATAAYLQLAGIDVTLLCRRQAVAETVCSQGLSLCGIRGRQSVPLRAVSSPAQLNGDYDFAVIATKTYDAAAAAQSILPRLAPQGLVLFLQNGVSIEEQAAAVGEDRLICGIVTWSCTSLGETALELTGEGGFIIGRPDGAPDPRINELKTALQAMAPTTISPDIFAAMYSKLIINSGITCGGALTGQRLGRMLLRGRARRFFIAIVNEDMDLARALGLRVPPFGGRLDYYRFTAGGAWSDRLRRQIMLFAIGLRYWRLKSSSLTALERGRPTEVDALNGWISARAAALGVKTPVNDGVVRLIKEIEQGKRASGPDNLKELL